MAITIKWLYRAGVPELVTTPDLADTLVKAANAIRDALNEPGEVVTISDFRDGLAGAVQCTYGDRKNLLRVALAFLDAGFPNSGRDKFNRLEEIPLFEDDQGGK